MNVKIKNKISSIFQKCKDNKSGFSLVELIVCGVILGTVTLTVCMMMSSGTNMFVGLNRQQNMMYRSQVAQAQIKEFFIDCDGICASGTKLFVASYDENRRLTLNAFDFNDEKSAIELFQYDTSKVEAYDINSEDPLGIPFSNKVTSFDYNIVSESGHASEIVFNFTFAEKNSTYSKQIIISMKNNPVYVVTPATGETIESTLIKTVGGVL